MSQDDDDEDDDVATVVAPAKLLLPQHLHDQVATAPQPAPTGPSKTVFIQENALPAAQPAAVAASPMSAHSAPTMLIGDRARDKGGAPTGFLVYVVICALLTAAGVAMLVVLRLQNRW